MIFFSCNLSWKSCLFRRCNDNGSLSLCYSHQGSVKPYCFLFPYLFLMLMWDLQFGFESYLKKINGYQYLSLFGNLVLLLLNSWMWFHYLHLVVHLHNPLFIPHDIFLLFPLLFILLVLWIVLEIPPFLVGVRMTMYFFHLSHGSGTSQINLVSSLLPYTWFRLPIWVHNLSQNKIRWSLVTLLIYCHFTSWSLVVWFPTPYSSSFSSYFHCVWCFPFILFIVSSSCLEHCPGNPILFIVVGMEVHLPMKLISRKWETQIHLVSPIPPYPQMVLPIELEIHLKRVKWWPRHFLI